MLSSTHSVSTMTPLRISFFGGGSDLPAYYETHGGLVVSMAIQEFIYVTVKRHSPIFGEKYRIAYYETEHANSVAEIKNDIVRACLELTGISEPLYISTSADIPAQSGLGSSSSFAVGLLNALHAFRGEAVSAGQLAEEAVEVELGILGKPIGKQDQYAAAFGGLNSFEFLEGGRVNVDPLTIEMTPSHPLQNLFLIWTGVQRAADTILRQQNENTQKNADSLGTLVEIASRFKFDLIRRNITPEEFGTLLTESWKVKRGLADTISSNDLDTIFSEIISAGALGAKLLGAGGGGFFLAATPTESSHVFQRNMAKRTIFPVKLEPRGSRVLHLTSRRD